MIYLLLFTYIKKVLCQFKLDGGHFISTFIDWKKYLKLETSNIDSDPKILEWYQPTVSTLLWITNIKLDISFVDFIIAHLASNPTLAYVLTIKQIFYYLSRTTIYIIYYDNNDNQKLNEYINSD